MIKQLQRKLSILLSVVSIFFLLFLLLFLFLYNKNSLDTGMRSALSHAASEPMDVPFSEAYPVYQVEVDENGEIQNRSGQDYFLKENSIEKVVKDALAKKRTKKDTKRNTKKGLEQSGVYGAIESGKIPYYIVEKSEPASQGPDEEGKESERSYRIAITEYEKEIESIERLSVVLLLLFFAFSAGIVFFSRYFVGKTLLPVKDALETQRQFVADASHELKTPLTVMINNVGNLEYDIVKLKESVEQPGEKKGATDTLFKMEGNIYGIREMSKRMQYLTESLLDLSRLENWQDRKQQFSSFSLSRLVETECLYFEPLFFEEERELLYQVPDSIALSGDENKVKQLVTILLDNALKYSVRGTKTELSLEKSGNKVFLRVSNAIKKEMGKEEREKLWKRFYRLEEARSEEKGYGLGLSIAKEIVRMHQGEIKVESVGKRICFTVTF